MHLSIIIPIYNSAALLQELHGRVTAAAQKISSDYEIIYVNDASHDASLERLIEIQQQDVHTTVIDLAHNFGQHPASITGLSHAKGDFIFLMDGDLEEDPEWLSEFYKAAQIEKTDLVLGMQEKHRGSGLDFILGSLFFWALTHIFKVENSKSISSACLMTRHYLNSLLQFKDKKMSFFAIGHKLRFKRAYVNVKKKYKGTSSYTLLKKFAHSVEYITCATTRPLLWVCFANGGLLCIGYPLFILFLVGFYVSGSITAATLWLTLFMSLFGAATVASMSIFGAYLFKITSEVVDRPVAVIKDIYRLKP